jgi:hypothetical protein
MRSPAPPSAVVLALFLACGAGWSVAGGACSVDGGGLGPLPDGATGGAGGGAACPAGLTEQASWPAKSQVTSCTRWCGPDDIGMQVCSQVDRSTCQAKPGCVCLESPCVTCATCAFLSVPDECYVPTNAATASACKSGVGNGVGCSPACGRTLCLQPDGKQACVCNSHGKYACADWNGSGWQ